MKSSSSHKVPGLHLTTSRRILGFMLSIPAIVLLFIFKLIPLLQSVRISFFQGAGFNRPMTFVGFQNYFELLGSDPLFRVSFLNTTKFFIISTLCLNILGVFLAVLVNSEIRGKDFFRTVLFLPVVISATATGLLWDLLLDPHLGIVNQLLRAIGLDSFIHLWLADTKIAMVTVSMVATWQSLGFIMVIYLAGLQTIDKELYEAAMIDGAGSINIFFKITLPLLKPFIAISLILCIIGGYSTFDLVYVMTQGGPVHTTETLMTYMYYAGFTQFRRGYASTIVITILLITGILGIVHNRITRRWEEV